MFVIGMFSEHVDQDHACFFQSNFAVLISMWPLLGGC